MAGRMIDMHSSTFREPVSGDRSAPRIKRIEFLGVPGVGKSTLIRYLHAQGFGGLAIHTELGAVKAALIEKKRSGKTLTDGERIMRWVYRLNIFPRWHGRMMNQVLGDTFRHLPWDTKEQLRALDLWLNLYCRSDYDPQVKALRIVWMMRRAKRIKYMTDHLPAGKLVMFEEGLLQSLLHIGPHSQDDLETLYPLLVSLDAVVFLDGVAEKVLRQVESSYHATRSYLYNTERVTLADVEKRLAAARQLADMAETKGIPVLRLHTDEAREEQRKRILQLLATLR